MRFRCYGLAPVALALAATPALAQSLPAAEAITAPGPLAPLAGTLIPPRDGGPVVLIIPGSGPTDRDGNSPAGIRAAPYRLLAEALATEGIGSLRFDKRGLFGSAGAVADANAVTVADYAGDIRAWVQVARDRTGATCIWLIGHSEGGLMALVAAQDAPGICGVVALATPGRRIGALLRDQLHSQLPAGPLLTDADSVIDRLEAGERVDVAAMHIGLQRLFAPAVQPYLIDLMAQDPLALAGSLPVPLLIVQGDADLQVRVADAWALGAVNPAARVAVLPGVNHVLKAAPAGNLAANVATYTNPALPVDPSVTSAIAAFVRGADTPPAATGADGG